MGTGEYDANSDIARTNNKRISASLLSVSVKSPHKQVIYLKTTKNHQKVTEVHIV